MTIKFDISLDPQKTYDHKNIHNLHLSIAAEDFTELTIIEIADLQKAIKERVKKSNDEQEVLRKEEVERFKVEYAAEDRLKGVLENPHAAMVPLNNICMAPPGYRFDENGAFVLNEETVKIPKTINQVPCVMGCYSWYEDKQLWGNTYWFWESDLGAGKANKVPCDIEGNRLNEFTVFYVTEKPETIDPVFMERPLNS